MNRRFALIGAGGYVAPRHLKAIKENKGDLLAAVDKSDSVGILDSYFPKTSFFTEFERFDRHLEMLKRNHQKLDYISVCSPNYLHDAHIRFGLRYGSNVICEKPMVLNPWNIQGLSDLENETGNKIYNILQLRLHPSIIALREKVLNGSKEKKYDVDLTYITCRGNWYYTSWKGDVEKSGGIATNIGIHFFDMLQWIFGNVNHSTVHLHEHDRAAGVLTFANANVRWFMSINADTMPQESLDSGKRTHRSFRLEGEEIEFSEGFEDLHTRSYFEILEGRGFGVSEVEGAIHLTHQIRTTKPVGLHGDYHPFAKLPLQTHPFKKHSER